MKWIFLDVSNLAYKALFSTGQLENGTIFGFLRDVINLQEEFQTSNVAFFFDSGKSKRLEILPEYKNNRIKKEFTKEEKDRQTDFRIQINELRLDHLTFLEFKNICYSPGYEADDLIASACKNLEPDDTAIIVSSDEDFYQLLSSKVSIKNQHSGVLITKKVFIERYGIPRSWWIDVKCLAGCKGDNIPGVKGIGEKTAIKYLKELLPETHKSFKEIEKGFDIWERNRKLIELPFPGTPIIKLVPDKNRSKKAWLDLTRKLKMPSIGRLALDKRVI